MPESTKQEKIRVRMAPSPTGALHVGTARTALFNYLFARRFEGEFVMRIEDTDTMRSEDKWEQDITEGLKWLGLEWDEQYKQSERQHIYSEYIEKLLQEGKAFYCRHTKEELKQERDKQMTNKEAPRHICKYRDKENKRGEGSIIRFKNDAKGNIEFSDLIRGNVSFNAGNLGDFSIARSPEDPLYNLAVVIDDHEMNITHIIRGEDHISNTPRQILILEALELQRPEYAHLPLLLGPDKSKLSKRHGATSVSEYRELGYLPEAMFNFLALLGWHPKDDEKEIMSKDEIIKEFAIEDIQQSGAIFDTEKLNWMNAGYIRKLDIENFRELCQPYMEKAGFINKDVDKKWLNKVLALEQERVKKLSDITEALEFIFKDIEYDSELLVWRKSDEKDALEQMQKLSDIIKDIDEKKWDKENLENIIMPYAEEVGDRGRVLWPLRAALSGRKASPGPFEIMEVLEKEKVLSKIDKSIKKLK